MNPSWAIGQISVDTPPTGLVLSIEDVRAHLHIDGTDDDPVLERMLRAATGRFDGPHGTGWALRQQRWRWVLSAWPCSERLPDSPQSWIGHYYEDHETIPLPGHPVTGLASVEYLTGPTTWTTLSDATLLESKAPEQPSLIYREGGFPDLVESRPYGIRIIYDVGIEAVPERDSTWNPYDGRTVASGERRHDGEHDANTCRGSKNHVPLSEYGRTIRLMLCGATSTRLETSERERSSWSRPRRLTASGMRGSASISLESGGST